MDGFKRLIPALTILFLVTGCTSGIVQGALSDSEIRDFSVIGEAESGPDQFQVYREALENGLRKAFALARQAEANRSLLARADQEKDLATLQRELGLVDFRNGINFGWRSRFGWAILGTNLPEEEV